jgi:ElaB/YqjD/DUF883 family membrane-anchored ribosome-binding protein
VNTNMSMSRVKKTFANPSKENLIRDFKVVIDDAQALLKATANQGGEMVGAARTKAEESLAIAKTKMAEAETALMQKGRTAVAVSDDYVRQNPWMAVGAAAGVGVLVGLLIGRR